jgi:prevent-host-death family protein
MTVVSTHEAKTHLSRLLDEIQNGEDIIIARGSRPVARLVPYHGKEVERRPGYLKGRIRVHEDFDAPLPDDLMASFEGGA